MNRFFKCCFLLLLVLGVLLLFFCLQIESFPIQLYRQRGLHPLNYRRSKGFTSPIPHQLPKKHTITTIPISPPTQTAINSYLLTKETINIEQSPTETLQSLKLRHELMKLPLSVQEITVIQSLLSQYLLSLQLIHLPASTSSASFSAVFPHLGKMKLILPKLIYSLGNLKSISPNWYLQKERDTIIQLLTNYYSYKSSNTDRKGPSSSSSSSSSTSSFAMNYFFEKIALSELFIGLCRLKISPYFLLSKPIFLENIQYELDGLSSTSPFSMKKENSDHYVLVGDLLWYFGSFSVKWSSLPRSLQSKMLYSYQRAITTFAASSLASSIWAFAKMGVQWRHFSDALQSTILETITQSMNKFTAQQSTKVLWSFSTLGLKFHQLSMYMLETLLTKVLVGSSSVGGNSLTVNNNLQDLEPSAIIPDPSSDSFQDASSSVSQGLVALAKMKTRWNELLNYSNRKYYPNVGQTATTVVNPPNSVSTENMDLVNKILDRFQSVCHSYNSAAISNSIWALGSMGLKLGTLSASATTSIATNPADYYNSASVIIDVRDVTSTMLQTILRILPECNAWTFTNILSGLSLMKFSWFDLPNSLQETIMATIIRLRFEMNTIDICTILYALAELDCTVDGLPSYFIDSVLSPILKNLSLMNGNELSNVISSISALGISWNVLPSSIQWSINSGIRREYQNMTAHALGNCVYGVTIMCFDAEETSDVSFRGVHETLLDGIISKIKGLKLPSATLPIVLSETETIEEEDLFNYRIFCHYVHIMQYITDPRRIPKDLLNYQLNRNRFKSQSSASSSTEERAVRKAEDEKLWKPTTSTESAGEEGDQELLRVFGFITPIRYTEREKHEKAIIQYYKKSSSQDPALVESNSTTISNLQEEIYEGLLNSIDIMSNNELLPASMQSRSSRSSSSSSSSFSSPAPVITSIEDSFLANKKFVISKEVSYFDGLFPIDLVIRLEDLPANVTIAPPQSIILATIEVNGPSHYTRSLQKLKRKDYYKETIYKRLFSFIENHNYPIQYHRMKYNEISLIGAEQLCNEFMIQLVERVEQYSQSPRNYYQWLTMKNSFWKVQQRLNEFFNWGLRNTKQDDDQRED